MAFDEVKYMQYFCKLRQVILLWMFFEWSRTVEDDALGKKALKMTMKITDNNKPTYV